MNWYIEKTTSKERRVICDTMLGLFVDLERANALLETVLDEQFSDREQAPLSASGADWTRSMRSHPFGYSVFSVTFPHRAFADSCAFSHRFL